MTSPMERTLKVIKAQDLPYWKVEYWNAFSRRRVDLFNIIDVIVLDNGIVGIQVCGSDISSHKLKIMDTEKNATFNWLSNGGRLEVWGWRKLVKKRGKKAKKWTPRIIDVMLIKNELWWEERE